MSFPTGLDTLVQTWTTGTYRALLLDTGWDPDPSADVYVDDITANEYAATGYVRQTLAGQARSVVLPATADDAGFVVFDCTDPSFGVMSGGTIAAWIAVYAFVTTDADSPLCVAFRCNYTADGVAAAAFVVSVNGLYRMATSCPSDWS